MEASCSCQMLVVLHQERSFIPIPISQPKLKKKKKIPSPLVLIGKQPLPSIVLDVVNLFVHTIEDRSNELLLALL